MTRPWRIRRLTTGRPVRRPWLLMHWVPEFAPGTYYVILSSHPNHALAIAALDAAIDLQQIRDAAQ